MLWDTSQRKGLNISGHHSLFSVHRRMVHWFPLHSRAFSASRRQKFCPITHSFWAITGECFTHSLDPREYIHSIHSNIGSSQTCFTRKRPFAPLEKWFYENQQVLNPTPLNPASATCHKRKRKLRCSFRSVALQKLHCNIHFSAARKSFRPKAALQRAKNCTATSKQLRCRKVALSCRFPAGFKPPRLGTHV